MATSILGITTIAASQTQKEVTANNAIQALENAANKALTLTVTDTNALTITTAQWQQQGTFVIAPDGTTPPTATIAVTVPAIQRQAALINTTAQTVEASISGQTADAVSIAAGTVGYIIADGTNARGVAGGSGSSGASAFLGLSDTPATFGTAGQVPVVNATGDALEWGSGGGGASAFTGLTDTPAAFTGQGGKAVAVNSGATALEFVDFPSGGSGTVEAILSSTVTLAADFTGVSGWTTVTAWASVNTNDLGAYSAAAQDRLTVPAGVTRCRVMARVAWQNSSTSARYLRIEHYDSTDTLIDNTATGDIRAAVNESMSTIATPFIAVSEGDYFRLAANAGTATVFLAGPSSFGGPCMFSMEASSAALPVPLAITDDTGSARTLALGDAGGYVRMDNSSANTVTVPPNSSVAFSVGTQVHIHQAGAGQTTIAAGAGVTINTPETLKLRDQHATATLVKVATDEWDLMGDLEAAP